MSDSSNQLLTAWRDKFQHDVECVGEYLSKCPHAEYTQIHDVFDDGDVYILTVGMAVRKDELTKMPDDVEKTKQEVLTALTNLYYVCVNSGWSRMADVISTAEEVARQEVNND